MTRNQQKTSFQKQTLTMESGVEDQAIESAGSAARLVRVSRSQGNMVNAYLALHCGRFSRGTGRRLSCLGDGRGGMKKAHSSVVVEGGSRGPRGAAGSTNGTAPQGKRVGQPGGAAGWDDEQ